MISSIPMTEATTSESINQVTGARKWGALALGKLVHYWQESLTYVGLDAIKETLALGSGEGQVIVLWHNRLLPVIGALRAAGGPHKQIYGLVSASKDGALLSVFLQQQGIRPIRGSSSRRGAVAARELIKGLRKGNSVAITVDGPRGPRYKVQAGALSILKATGAPIVLVGAEAENATRLNSWDQFMIPRPFSRVHVFCHRYPSLPEEAGGQGKDGRERARLWLEQELTTLTRDRHLA
jgi:lysophospholipid acyltransferase (LPLAT)-like uncharacterized protein